MLAATAKRQTNTTYIPTHMYTQTNSYKYNLASSAEKGVKGVML